MHGNLTTIPRGLPSGYIASIEDRLAQTEAALLHALSTIHAPLVPGPEMFSVATQKPRDLEYNELRIAKVEEWQKYPLDTLEHRQAWIRYKLSSNGTQIPTEPPKSEDTSDVSSNLRRSQYRQQSYPARKRQKTVSESQRTMIPARSDEEGNLTESPTLSLVEPGAETSNGAEALPNLSQTDSKAKKLSTLHSSKYF